MTDGQTIRFGHLINMIGSDQASRSGHVFHDEGGIAGDVSVHVPCKGPRIDIEASARREPDDDSNSLALIKRSCGMSHTNEGQQSYCSDKTADPLMHKTPGTLERPALKSD